MAWDLVCLSQLAELDISLTGNTGTIKRTIVILSTDAVFVVLLSKELKMFHEHRLTVFLFFSMSELNSYSLILLCHQQSQK